DSARDFDDALVQEKGEAVLPEKAAEVIPRCHAHSPPGATLTVPPLAVSLPLRLRAGLVSVSGLHTVDCTRFGAAVELGRQFRSGVRVGEEEHLHEKGLQDPPYISPKARAFSDGYVASEAPAVSVPVGSGSAGRSGRALDNGA